MDQLASRVPQKQGAATFGVLGFGKGRGSWVVVSGATSPLIWFIAIVTILITPLALLCPRSRNNREGRHPSCEPLVIFGVGPAELVMLFHWALSHHTLGIMGTQALF